MDLRDQATRPAPKALTIASSLDRVGAQEAGQVAAVCLPRLSVEAGRIGLGAGGGGVVGGRQMVDQLLSVLQEALPGVETGADHRDRPQAFIGRVVKDGQRQLLQQLWGQVPAVGHVVLPVLVARPRRR
jgi:hypothetical protein